MEDFFVGPLGLEPRLFYTKNRRVASYTMGQYRNADANLIQTLACTTILVKIFKNLLSPVFNQNINSLITLPFF